MLFKGIQQTKVTLIHFCLKYFKVHKYQKLCVFLRKTPVYEVSILTCINFFVFFRAKAEDDPRTLQTVDAGKYR